VANKNATAIATAAVAAATTTTTAAVDDDDYDDDDEVNNEHDIFLANDRKYSASTVICTTFKRLTPYFH
jgi:hypothetical protein